MKIKNTEAESTPFVECRILDKVGGKVIAWFKLYWSARAGQMGYQVCYEGNDHRKEDAYFQSKTSGYGYSKECQALNDCLRYLVGTAPSCHHEASSLLRSIHKGGNYYHGSIGQIKKAIKAHK